MRKARGRLLGSENWDGHIQIAECKDKCSVPSDLLMLEPV